MSYQWFKDGEILVAGPRIQGVSGPVLTISEADWFDSGIFTVVVDNGFGGVESPGGELTLMDEEEEEEVWLTTPDISNGQVQFEVFGALPNIGPVRLETSPDLHLWTPVVTNATTGAVDLPINGPRLFYRAQLVR